MIDFGLTKELRRRQAFTLIELLVVVAIISILSAIAVPNFLEAQTRAKVARLKNDMRTLSNAVETYYIDNQAYPVRHNMSQGIPNPIFLTKGSIQAFPEKTNKTNPYVQASQMSVLTTPIAYLGSLPIDVFDSHETYPNNLIDYWDGTQTMWFINSSPGLYFDFQLKFKVLAAKDINYTIFSMGPDGYLGMKNGNTQKNDLNGWPLNPGDSSQAYSAYHPYDPTNGTVSPGNIYMIPKLGGLDGTPQNLYNKLWPAELRIN